ncbi:MAG: TIGR00730 family Rossman fold protein [Maricaulaceae bacterium]|nr:TIGR00730 family Rossman fold protein [Maricaulaceae bacterium]
MKAICVYCGSNTGRNGLYAAAARAMGAALARRNITLVYGGGMVGLMGVVADACLEAGGRVTGVIPEFLAIREVAHDGLTEMRVVGSMHERKAEMARLADGFVALPGGLGTLEELFEILTWGQLGHHAKPCGILTANGYYDGLLTFLDRMSEEGFVTADHRAMLKVADDPDALLDAFAAYQAPAADIRLKVGQT